MLDPNSTLFSHVKPGDNDYVSGGLRDFFPYRDLGVAAATHGKVIAHLVKANMPPTNGTGWHYHVCDAQFVYVLKGWVELQFEETGTVRLEAGDAINIPGYLAHNEIRTSDELEILEVSVPAALGTQVGGSVIRPAAYCGRTRTWRRNPSR